MSMLDDVAGGDHFRSRARERFVYHGKSDGRHLLISYGGEPFMVVDDDGQWVTPCDMQFLAALGDGELVRAPAPLRDPKRERVRGRRVSATDAKTEDPGGAELRMTVCRALDRHPPASRSDAGIEQWLAETFPNDGLSAASEHGRERRPSANGARPAVASTTASGRT